MELIQVVATNDEYDNDPKRSFRIDSPRKLQNIYAELRANVFIGEPIQENSGDNNLVFRTMAGPDGNYGWQLFRVKEGTAMLEYRGPVSYWEHERRPRPLGEENGLQDLWLTFHQKGASIFTARKIIDKNTRKRPK